ncbi:hypothetical protein MKW92_015561 [Papaver armeniacum]|nr:hypothetical protein MKW92_015561 [Papaver armeniacum]
MVALLDLFIASSIPVVEVLLVTGLGSFLALDSINILGDDARKLINNVVFYVFNPALISGNLSKTITYDSMVKLWFMPVNILITFIAGSVFGWVLIQFTRPPSHLRVSFWAVVLPIGAIYLWSYVYNLVRIFSTNTEETKEDIPVSSLKFPDETSKLFPESCTEELLPSNYCSISGISEDQSQLPYSINPIKKIPFLVKCRQQFEMMAEHIHFKRLFAPSTIGAIVGFFIGIVPQIRTLLIGESAPLRVIQDSATLLSNAAVPTLTLIVGGNLTKGIRGSGMQKSVVIGIVVVRYILLPVLGVIVVKGAFRLGLIQSDPLYQFVLLLQFVMPPAMNIGIECSVILLWTYSVASISLTIWTTFFLWLVSS